MNNKSRTLPFRIPWFLIWILLTFWWAIILFKVEPVFFVGSELLNKIILIAGFFGWWFALFITLSLNFLKYGLYTIILTGLFALSIFDVGNWITSTLVISLLLTLEYYFRIL